MTSLTDHRSTSFGMHKTHNKSNYQENTVLKGKASTSQTQKSAATTRKPFADISNQKRNGTNVASKPQEKPTIAKKVELEDIDYAYFNDYKIPYTVDSIERFDVCAFVSQPVKMKPYVPIKDKTTFELAQIEEALFDNSSFFPEEETQLNFEVNEFDFPEISFSDSEEL